MCSHTYMSMHWLQLVFAGHDLNSSSESDTLKVAKSRLILSNISVLAIIILLRSLLCNWLQAEDVQDCVRCCFCLEVRPRLLPDTYFSEVGAHAVVNTSPKQIQ